MCTVAEGGAIVWHLILMSRSRASVRDGRVVHAGAIVTAGWWRWVVGTAACEGWMGQAGAGAEGRGWTG